MFDIHKIRPVHGWREFVGEVGIIVLGIMLALTAEQIVETIHWRRQVAEARAGIGSDLAVASTLIRERELYTRCIANRIRDIALILDKAGKTGRLPPVGPIGQPSIRSYLLPSWSALAASGLAAHFSPEDLVAYRQLATAGEEMTALNRDEQVQWAALYAIVGPGRPIGAEELSQHYRELSQIGYRAKLVRLWGAAMSEAIRSARVPLDQAALERDGLEWPRTRARVAGRSICKPLAAAPAHYGNSFDSYSLDDAIDQGFGSSR